MICFTGDGGFWYHLSELETARRHNINTVTIINNNGGFAQGIDDVHAMYGDRPGNPEELYRFEPVNFARIAQEMGCLGIRVEHPDEIGPALREALAADRPIVVEVLTGIALPRAGALVAVVRLQIAHSAGLEGMGGGLRLAAHALQPHPTTYIRRNILCAICVIYG